MDSDYSVVCWVSPGSGLRGAVFGEEIARGYADGRTALVLWSDQDGNAVSLSEWSQELPRPIDAQRAESILTAEYGDASDVLADLLVALGLQIKWPPDQFLGAEEIDADGDSWPKKRYVTGDGKDFAGIWDSDVVAAALKQFPRTREGKLAARKAARVMNKKAGPR